MSTLNKYVIAIIIIIIALASSNIDWGKKNWHGIIQSDGKGYYSYLPAIFIYHDLNFGFFEEVEKKCFTPNTYYDYRASSNGKVINKYYSGVAIAMLPFFLIAHALTHLSGYEVNGYSYYYHVFTNIAAIFYLCIGLIFLKKLLKRYSASASQITLILPAITFGTNIFYYVVIEPAMSHVYSFCFVCIFLYQLKKFFEEGNTKSLLIASVCLGIIILIRPVNAFIVAAVPFLAGSFENLKERLSQLLKRAGVLSVALLIALSIFSIQLIIYKIQTGSYFVDSYTGEGFNWADPHFIDILFSYKKGLFIYTPVAFLSLLGFIFLWKTSRYLFFSLLFFLIVITYVLSSWWNWYYGGSFGLRAYIEFLPLFALLMLFAFEGISKKALKLSYSILIVLLILVCQFQTYQYRYYFIHWDKMDKQRYWNVFLRVDQVVNKQNPNADLLGNNSNQ